MLSTIYLIILFLFLLVFTFYLSKEILRILREERLIKISSVQTKKTTQTVNKQQNLELINLYLYRKIFDAAIYELNFGIKNFDYDEKELSILYYLLGQSYDNLGIENTAFQKYSQALEINPINEQSVLQIVKKLVKDKKYNSAIKKCEYFLQGSPNNERIKDKLKELNNKSLIC
uniref:hypothetical protein n=1 Tax=Madagascaria erythrocladioides TaxID=753684 RepID=UPI001FCD6D33|nr:hypothetical protein MW574_pgp033 [Madagascaria erythrocladioides]UNJ16634.1 hypothetical protein [Madagascaria erythrocladioides]